MCGVRKYRSESVVWPNGPPTWSADDPPRFGTRMFAVPQHRNTIYHHVHHPDSVLLGLLIGGTIGDRGGIKHRHVGKVPELERPATFEAKIGRW